jgi:hypothetical protein
VSDRLGRRGKLAITAEDGVFTVRLVAPGPYVGGWCTSDKGDLFEHCHLGAKDWHGEGSDLAALLVECDEQSRPRPNGPDDLRFAIEYRRSTRTCGPPLPSYRRWYGWAPGHERWLRTSSHQYEYLDGYLRDLKGEIVFEEEQAASRLRRTLAQVPARLMILVPKQAWDGHDA